MIYAENVSKRFTIAKTLGELILSCRRPNKSIQALDTVSLKVHKGQILALLGPNGAGKTTLIKVLCALILPDSGKIKICGYDLQSAQNQVKSLLGLVTGEERSLYWQLSGRQNLQFFGALYNLSAQKIKAKIQEVNQLLAIDDLDKPARNYSTGMKQRLMLARCLLSDPQVILMDEPTKSLDPASAKNLRYFIREHLAKKMGKTILLATHQTAEAEELADEIAIIDQGKIKAQGALPALRKITGLSAQASLEEIYLQAVGDKSNKTST